jgi:hypothetical protein
MMKRCAAVPLEVVEHKGYYYATTDFVDPGRESGNSHVSYIALRDGWEPAPDETDIVEAVLKYKWGGWRNIFLNGKSYHCATSTAYNLASLPRLAKSSAFFFCCRQWRKIQEETQNKFEALVDYWAKDDQLSFSLEAMQQLGASVHPYMFHDCAAGGSGT